MRFRFFYIVVWVDLNYFLRQVEELNNKGIIFFSFFFLLSPLLMRKTFSIL